MTTSPEGTGRKGVLADCWHANPPWLNVACSLVLALGGLIIFESLFLIAWAMTGIILAMIHGGIR